MSRVLFDKKELIAYLNNKMTMDTLGRLVRSGDIPYVKFPKIRRYYFDKDQIDSWINNLSSQNTGKRS